MTFTVTPELTLDDVAERFEQWRSTKKLRERIPTELWELARSLKGRYKSTHISLRLRIATSQMRREGLIPPAKPKQKKQSTEKKKFVNVQLDSVLQSGATIQPTLALKRADGTQLTLSQPSNEHLMLFIKSLMG